MLLDDGDVMMKKKSQRIIYAIEQTTAKFYGD